MAKIILVDSDSNFLAKLEWYFMKQSDDDELITISSRDYLINGYFSKPQTADALLISEDMLFSDIEKHNIAHIFTLTEAEVESGTDRLDGKRMSKYTTSIPEIYNIVTGILKASGGGEQKKSEATCTVVLCYSPVGGVGTTSIAVGLSATLYKNYKKTLFLSTDGLQTFNSFFSEEHYLEAWQDSMFRSDNDEAIAALNEMVRTELCDYLPPYDSPLCTLDNCILTPHAGAATKEASSNMSLMAAQNAVDVLTSGECRFEV